MEFELKYGKGTTSFRIPKENVKAVIKREDCAASESGEAIIQNALKNPIGSPMLKDLISARKPKNIVIVVNDVTRPTPYKHILPPLLKEIEESGIQPDQITLLVATGIHRAHTEEENEAIYGHDICRRYKVINHDPDVDQVNLGYLPNGIELWVNKLVADADLLITTGLIGLHYFAGYSGGRKSIVPGCAGRQTITASHAMMSDSRACLGNVSDNPVHSILTECGIRSGIDYIVNVITDDNKQIVAAVAGDMQAAWNEGVRICRNLSVCSLDEPVDIVVAGCGGYPKDINIYQAQKALESAVLAVRDQGVIILVAQCIEGMGEDTFSRWIEEAKTPQDIKDRFNKSFELGGHKAYAICRTLDKSDIVLISDMDKNQVSKTFMTPASSVDDALAYAFGKLGSGASVAVIPEASSLAVEIVSNKPNNSK